MPDGYLSTRGAVADGKRRGATYYHWVVHHKSFLMRLCGGAPKSCSCVPVRQRWASLSHGPFPCFRVGPLKKTESDGPRWLPAANPSQCTVPYMDGTLTLSIFLDDS